MSKKKKIKKMTKKEKEKMFIDILDVTCESFCKYGSKKIEEMENIIFTLSVFLTGLRGYNYNKMLSPDLLPKFKIYLESIVIVKKDLIDLYNDSLIHGYDCEYKNKYWLINKSFYVYDGEVKLISLLNQLQKRKYIIEVFNNIDPDDKKNIIDRLNIKDKIGVFKHEVLK